MLDVILFLNSINGGHIKLSSNELVTVLLGANSEAFHTFCLELNPLTILMIMIISMFVIGQVGKELFCVKKSILVRSLHLPKRPELPERPFKRHMVNRVCVWDVSFAVL